MLILPVSNNMSYDPYEKNLGKEKEQSVDIGRQVDIAIEKFSPSVSSEPSYEYVNDKDGSDVSTGVYKIEHNEDGKLRVVLKDPASDGKAVLVDGTKDSGRGNDTDVKTAVAASKKTKRKTKECTVNTDRVDAEIKKLKGQKRQIEQEIKNASNDEEKIAELKIHLANIVTELRMKDNDSYRKQNASYSYD